MIEKLPKVGDLLGRFEIKRQLGQGGMGIVFLARDPLLNVDVALKVLKPQFVKSGNFERIQREVLLARKVSHPGICRLYDIHKEDETLFITMEYVAGPTLRSLLDSKGIISIDQSVGLISDICDAIAAAHKLEVIHRDLKPGNIVVRGRTQISILDFGLAKAMNMSSITATDIHVGTYYYMSPEVLKGKLASVQSDIYSLGVILYECVTGRPPYTGEGVYEIGQAIQNGKPVPPAQFNPQVSPKLEEIINQAIAPDPKQRFQTIGDLKTSLDFFQLKPFEPIPAKTQATVVVAEENKSADEVATPPDPADRQAEISTPGPWHGDVEKSVAAAFHESQYSEMYRQSMRESTMLFSDIVGITPYFDKHGDVAGLKKIKLHNDLLSPVIKRYRGEVIKTIGDAYMVSFDKADDGVGAAIAMQRALAKHNRTIDDDDQKIFIRIGLNSGKSIFNSQDVFGDVVNVAARVSAQAKGDQVIISAATYDLLGPTKHLASFHSETTLKGKSTASKLYTIEWELQQEASTMVIKNGRAELNAALAKGQTEQPAQPPSPVVKKDREQDVPELPHDSFSEMQPQDHLFEMVDDILSEKGSEKDAKQPAPDTLVSKMPEDDKATVPGLEGSLAPLERSRYSAVKWGLAGGAALILIVLGAVIFSNDDGKSKNAQDAGLAMIDPTLQPSEEARAEIVDAGGQEPVGLDAGIVEAADQAKVDPADKAKIGPADRAKSSLADAGRIEPADSGRKPPPADKTAIRSKLKALRKKTKDVQSSVYSAMRKKGIISGDSRNLDKELDKMKKMTRRKKYSKAIAAANKATRIVENIKIDRAFVERKSTRFNKLYDKIGGTASEKEVGKLIDYIWKAKEKRNFTRANRLFNQAFKVLRKGRR